MKFISTFILFTMSLLAFSQQILRIKTVDQISNETLSNVEVRLIATDGSITEKLSDENGIVSFSLEQNTSYVFNAYDPKYYKGKGIESTIDKNDSIVINHILQLKPMITIHEGFRKIDLDSTHSYDPLNLESDTIILIQYDKYYDFKDQSDIAFHLIRDSETEYKVLGVNERQVSVELVDTSLIQITVGKEIAKYWIIGYSNCHSFWYELIKKN